MAHSEPSVRSADASCKRRLPSLLRLVLKISGGLAIDQFGNITTNNNASADLYDLTASNTINSVGQITYISDEELVFDETVI